MGLDWMEKILHLNIDKDKSQISGSPGEESNVDFGYFLGCQLLLQLLNLYVQHKECVISYWSQANFLQLFSFWVKQTWKLLPKIWNDSISGR